MKEILCHVGTFLDNNLVLIANKTVMFIVYLFKWDIKNLEKKKEDESRNTVFSIEKKTSNLIEVIFKNLLGKKIKHVHWKITINANWSVIIINGKPPIFENDTF